MEKDQNTNSETQDNEVEDLKAEVFNNDTQPEAPKDIEQKKIKKLKRLKQKS